MVEKRTMARPYATAVFEIARAKNAYENWSMILKLLTWVVEDPSVKRLIKDQRMSAKELADFFLSILEASKMSRSSEVKEKDPEKPKNQNDKEFVQNFVKLLAERRRLNILPEISELFEELRADAENKLKVRFTSAISLEEEQKNRFKEKLAKDFQKNVQIQYEVDPKLIGGFVIRMGDKVIDGSIKGQLQSLQEKLNG